MKPEKACMERKCIRKEKGKNGLDFLKGSKKGETKQREKTQHTDFRLKAIKSVQLSYLLFSYTGVDSSKHVQSSSQ